MSRQRTNPGYRKQVQYYIINETKRYSSRDARGLRSRPEKRFVCQNKQGWSLFEIASDGKVDDTEIKDFTDVKEKLEELSLTVDALQLWVDEAISSGTIDPAKITNTLSR